MPVWDDVLSEHDRKHLAARGPRQRRGLGERPALLVIDMNCGSVGENRPIYEQLDKYPLACGLYAWAAIPHMQEVIRAARGAGIPVVYTHMILKAIHDLPRAKDPKYMYSELSPQSEFQPEVAPQPGDLVIETQQHSAFSQTPLLAVLLNKKVDTLIVMGTSTSVCVRATIVDATSYHCFKVAVVEECVFDRFELSHKAALFDLQRAYCDVVSLKEVMEYIEHLKAIKGETARV